jgi:cytoskeletal protein RodZ
VVPKIVNPWRLILSVVIVALGSAAIWAWHEGSQQADATLVRAESPAPVQQSPLPALDHAAVSETAPAPASSPQAEPAPAASDGNQFTTSAAVDPPDVDTPEPAQEKFARGGHADSDQN